MYPAGDLRGLLIVEAHQPPGNIDPWPMQCLVIVAGGLPVNALAAPQDLRHISIARSLCRPLFKSGQLAPGALYHAPVLTQQTADIIFLTTSPGFAYESYGVRAAEYLLKPINAKLLYPVLDKLYLREQKPQDGLTVKSNGMLVRLPFSQLSYVEVNGKHLFFNMADGTVYEVAASMREYEGALLLFGSLPVTYYIFDYATTIYSDALYSGIQALNEFLPTVLVTFYVLFLPAFHLQSQRRADAEMQRSMLEAELEQSQSEMDSLHRLETQTAVYQHDMRHHLNMLDGLLSVGRPDEAAAYIKKVQADIEAITPRRFCENHLVNLLCSSFTDKAQRQGTVLTVDASLPNDVAISDTELCSLLSNGLENALHAVADLPADRKQISLYCGVRQNKLLIEIRNPCAGPIAMRDGLPVSDREGHGYGCRSIQAIAQRNGGLCVFSARQGQFLLQIMLPVLET